MNGKSLTMSVGLAVFALVIAVFWGSACMSRNMEADAKSATSADFVKLGPGETAKVVLEVGNVTAGTIGGTVLDPAGQNTYVRSLTPIHVRFDSSTQIVMGGASEIRPGAVIHTTGTLNKDRTIQAKQLVILTGYAKVK